MKSRYPTVLTIAGSDSGGGAGVQADLKTFSALGVYGTSAITAVTAQNTQEVRTVETLSIDIIRQQVEAVLDDIAVDAVKTGMLPTPGIIETVAALIDRYNLKNVIVDPVMVATSGARLAIPCIAEAFRKHLYRRAMLFTPNIPEAEALSGINIQTEDDFQKAADIMMEQGCRAVLIKGGHFTKDCATDILFGTGKGESIPIRSRRVESKNLHGTGCTFSSAIAANIALGLDLTNAVKRAKTYIFTAIENGKDITVGNGYGPVNHLFSIASSNGFTDNGLPVACKIH
ncbi:MAG: bifunctional hydroxymethylpyrimidine kinase/phosphomethylpyrimidine kinase [Dysgonamonadaceae bacterium]|jgi:hydroxymethylpyrimidine/phosphomethylpyrimidine kinase|nr:bifunctional hydroxymethylpyrimidine kinase/phosphomethylpyrimidine kinase [Dysgonamonadaceae bacterium]